MANVTYWGKGIKFSTYKNGLTPYIGDNGNWWTSEGDTGQKAQGADGVSFSGVEELYYAALAGAADQGKPNWPENNKPAESQLLNWKGTIQDTQFGQKDDKGVTYKYLWNVEKIITTGPEGEYATYTSPNLIQIYDGGRIPAEYISYYAGNTTNEAPWPQPSLTEDGNEIVFKKSNGEIVQIESEGGDASSGAPETVKSTWETNGVTADANNYLFEITFVKYAKKDENGENLYAKIEGPTLIGRNGADALNLTLNNDSDVVAITESGQVIKRKVGNTSEMITKVEASLTSNGKAYEGEISLTPPSTEWEDHYRSRAEEENGTRWLIIDSLPEGFTEGDFVFEYNNLKRNFHLSTKKSEVDYNLSLSRTLINSSETDGTITVIVKKTDAAGRVTDLTNAEDAKKDNIYLYTGPNETDTELNNDWFVKFDKGNTDSIYFDIREEHEANGEKSSFTWDYENVEFIKNGELIGRYTLSLDNDFDIVVKQPDETWLSTDDIVVTATGYDGRQLQENIRVKITPYGTIPGEEGSTEKINWSGICEGLETDGTIISNELTIHPSKLPITFQEATFTFEWLLKDGSPDGDYIPLDTKKFTLKAITSIADYDLVIPQTVYNASSNDQSVNVWVRKKSDGKTETISEYKETLPVQIYLKTVTEGADGASTTTGYELQKKWDLDISDRVKKHLILCNAAVDKDNKLIEKPTAEQLGFVWDEEIIEFVKDGTSGQNIYILYHDADLGTDETLQKPKDKDYANYPKEKDDELYDGWYPIETKNSVFRVSKICLPEKQANTDWGPIVSNQGTEGPASCSLSLSSDSDTIVKSHTGKWISTEIIEVTAEAFIGADLQVEGSADKDNPTIPITLTPPDDWNGKGYYTYDSLKKTLSIDPQDITIDFTSVEFTFQWEIQPGDTITKKFSLKAVTGLVDYDLIVPQTVYNKDKCETEFKVPVYVLEKSQGGARVVEYDDALAIAIYKKNGEKYVPCNDWTSGISLDTEGDEKNGMHLVLGNKPIVEESPEEGTEPMPVNLEQGEIVEEEIIPSFIWDEEIIELVSDGLPAEMPFTISLMPDYISVPCDSLANVVDNFVFPEIEPTIYHGQDVSVDWNTLDDGSTPTREGNYLTVKGDGIKATWSNKKVSLSNMTGQEIEITQGETTETIRTDTALVTFKFYRYEESDDEKMVGELKGSAVTEVVKKLGSLGAIRCYVESSLGTMFEASEAEGELIETDLTARIFEGSKEIDPGGTLYDYTWHHTDDTINFSKITDKGKTIKIKIKHLANKEVWFTTSLKSNSQTT